MYKNFTELGVHLAKNLLTSLRTLFSNNIDIKVIANPLFNDFRGNSIILLFFLGLNGSDRLSLRLIYYILDLFFLRYLV